MFGHRSRRIKIINWLMCWFRRSKRMVGKWLKFLQFIRIKFINDWCIWKRWRKKWDTFHLDQYRELSSGKFLTNDILLIFLPKTYTYDSSIWFFCQHYNYLQNERKQRWIKFLNALLLRSHHIIRSIIERTHRIRHEPIRHPLRLIWSCIANAQQRR